MPASSTAGSSRTPRYESPASVSVYLSLSLSRTDGADSRSACVKFADYCGAILNYDLTFLDYCRDPDILNMVSQCIGPDIALWNSSFFAKPAETGRKVPWCADTLPSTARRSRTATKANSGLFLLRVAPGTRMGSTGRSVRWPPAPSGLLSTTPLPRTAVSA